MKYDISKSTAPKMPNLGRGAEIIKLLLSQVSKDMHEPLVPMFFPSLAAHVSGTEFLYPDNTYKELCGMMAQLCGDSGCNKGQLTTIVNAICRDFRQHDAQEEQKLVSWANEYKCKTKEGKRPERPEAGLFFPFHDQTAAGFLLNAHALEVNGGFTQYLNMPEVEMADKLCGGHRNVSQIIRNVFDQQRTGALRATADGVTMSATLRACMTFSGNPDSVRSFYKTELHNGTFGRITFSFVPRRKREGRIPRQGLYPEEFYQKLDAYLDRLKSAKGRFTVRPLNKLADKLAEQMAELADLTDSDSFWGYSKRSIINAWKAGCVLWLLNDQTYTHTIGELVEWLVYRDLWSKGQVSSYMKDMSEIVQDTQAKTGPKNMLDSLPKSFNEVQLEALRAEMGKSKEGTKGQLSQWVFRKFITFSEETGLYTKTESYLDRSK